MIAGFLVSWYRESKRTLPWRETADPYRIWVSEVMLQQTQVNTVIPYYINFIAAFPTVERLASASSRSVLKHWEGLGYYARARNLHRACRIIVNEMNGIMPMDYDTFISLPGVGDYIASAVMSISSDAAHAVVDGNVKRVLARLFLIRLPVNRSGGHKEFKNTATLLMTNMRPSEFNQAIMELGALVCTPRRPKCLICPLRVHCGAHDRGETDRYPVRIKKPPVPEYDIAAGVVTRDGRLLITRRPPEGLLGGLWEFPGGKIKNNESPEAACIREIFEETGLTVSVTTPLTVVRHAYTHFKISMQVFCCQYRSGEIQLNGPVDHAWVTPEQLGNYPFPRANHKFMPLLESCHAQ